MADCSSPSSSSTLSSEMTEYHSVMNKTPSLSHRRNPSSVEILKELIVLEDEIVHLENYLLSLYRSTYRQHLQAAAGKHILHMTSSSADLTLDGGRSEKYDNGRQVVTSESAPVSTRNSMSQKEKTSCYGSLAHLLGHPRPDTAHVFPDRLSEDIIRCIASIYCRLSKSKDICRRDGYSVSSPCLYGSSVMFSPRNSWNPQFTDETGEMFEMEGTTRGRDKGPYSAMLEVVKIGLDKETDSYTDKILRRFRSLIKSLESVDPKKMTHEEKLAFWINIHNSLVMHGYLRYGTRSYSRSSVVMEASYNVGGYWVNAYDIQAGILGIKGYIAAPWLHKLLYRGKKLRTSTSKHPYAIDYPEPLVHFALCLGTDTDPAVRVYSAKIIFDDLKVAKEEFLQSAVHVDNQTKLQLPKILRYYAKDASLNIAELLDVVSECLTPAQQKVISRFVNSSQPEKHVYWIKRSSFRYVIHQELA